MTKGTIEKRRLIKFSNYSMCVTLPKWVIDQLVWRKGDVLTLVTDVKHGKITLFREDKDQQTKNASISTTNTAMNNKTPTQEQIIPVNELTPGEESADEQIKPRW